MLKFQFK